MLPVLVKMKLDKIEQLKSSHAERTVMIKETEELSNLITCELANIKKKLDRYDKSVDATLKSSVGRDRFFNGADEFAESVEKNLKAVERELGAALETANMDLKSMTDSLSKSK